MMVNQSPELDFVGNLLKGLSNPKVAKEHLEQIKKAKADLDAARAKFDADKKAWNQERLAIDRRQNDKHLELIGREDKLHDIEAKKAAADKRAVEVDSAGKALNRAEQEYAVKATAQKEREARLVTQEKALTDRHAGLEAWEGRLAQQAKELNERVAKLKTLVS